MSCDLPNIFFGLGLFGLGIFTSRFGSFPSLLSFPSQFGIFTSHWICPFPDLCIFASHRGFCVSQKCCPISFETNWLLLPRHGSIETEKCRSMNKLLNGVQIRNLSQISDCDRMHLAFCGALTFSFSLASRPDDAVGGYQRRE